MQPRERRPPPGPGRESERNRAQARENSPRRTTMVPAAMAMALGVGPEPAGPPVGFVNRGAQAGMNPLGGSEAAPYPADTDQLLNLLVPESRRIGARNSMIVVEIPIGWSLVCAHAPGASIVVPPLTDAVTGWEWTIDPPVCHQPARIRWTRRDFSEATGAVWFPFTVHTPRGPAESFPFRVHQTYDLGTGRFPDPERAGGQIDWVDPLTCRMDSSCGPTARCPHPAPLRFVAEGRPLLRLMGERERWVPDRDLPACCGRS